MWSILRSARRHLGISAPLFVVYAGAVLLGSGGEVDGQIVAVLALVLIATLLTPVAVSAINRRYLRGSWDPALEPGERVLFDGACDRYEAPWVGWLFLTDRRLVLYGVGGREEWSVPLAAVAEVNAARYAGLFATDLRVALHDGTSQRLKVEGSSEWAEKARGALQDLPADRARGV
jgi:hypothetical protein